MDIRSAGHHGPGGGGWDPTAADDDVVGGPPRAAAACGWRFVKAITQGDAVAAAWVHAATISEHQRWRRHSAAAIDDGADVAVGGGADGISCDWGLGGTDGH